MARRHALSLLTALALVGCDGAVDADAGVDESPFAVEVVSYVLGVGGGFGEDALPDIVLGPPEGGGEQMGALDVLSLGHGGELVLRLGVDVADGEGPDLIVFENAFRTVTGAFTFKEPASVALSLDGETWSEFECIPEAEPPNGCAGMSPVYSHPDNGVSPTDPAVAGGDAFDLAVLGLERARFVRITDLSESENPDLDNGGADIDAVAVVNSAD